MMQIGGEDRDLGFIDTGGNLVDAPVELVVVASGIAVRRVDIAS